VGIEGGMMTALKATLAVALVLPLALPEPATAAKTGATSQRTKITVRPKRLWRGYGFLPGYHPQLAEINGLPIIGPDPRRKREWRYVNWYNGQVQYGWGYPGYYRGRWNGGSFGPCWTSTPIGMMPNCGQ